jgi:peptidyl-prolyl cis-trans isomerase A (cyclophilin A)
MFRTWHLTAVLMIFAQGAFAEPDTVTVRLTTALGDIDVEVHLAGAPVTAANFLRLVDNGHLDGATFYRTVSPENDNGSPPISVIQGGLGDVASPYPAIAHETTAQTGLQHRDGAISMARAAVNTATTEFFICIGDQPALDFGGTRNPDGQGFAVFGYVSEGMQVVRRIHELAADAPVEFEYFEGQLFAEPIAITAVRRVATPEPAPAAGAGIDQ